MTTSTRSIPALASAATIAAVLATVILPTAPVRAQGVTYTGALTTASPTFNHPISNSNKPPVSLSTVGTRTYYSTQAFYVSVTGNYNLLVTPTFDSYLCIYQTDFNPSTPLVNGVASNDDFMSTAFSGFASLTLTANVQYFAVTTTYANNVTGTFTNNIGNTSRPTNAVVTLGTVTVAAPESGTIALMLTVGVPLLGTARRRKKQA